MCSETRNPECNLRNTKEASIWVLVIVLRIVLVAWGMFLDWFWCLGRGFWHYFRVLVEVFGLMSWSRVHLGAENLVEPSSGTSRALSGTVLDGPGGLWQPIARPFGVRFDVFGWFFGGVICWRFATRFWKVF